MKLNGSVVQIAWYWNRWDAIICAAIVGGHFRLMKSAGKIGYGVFLGRKYALLPLPR